MKWARTFLLAMTFAASGCISSAQTLVTLASFNSTNGANPNELTLGPDGNFYGTTAGGGTTNSSSPSGMGTVFKVTTNGVLTSLVSFSGTNGANPMAGLTLGSDGNFYGTTQSGGTNGGYGTVFQVTTNGTLNTLVSFNYTNGYYPVARLTLGPDGNFYGTTQWGGTNGGYGTVFKVATNGVLTSLVSFSSLDGQLFSMAGLALDTDGNFYGTTEQTVFKMTTNGTLTRLCFFPGPNAADPMGELTLDTDGNFYGTTVYGTNSEGSVFQVTTNGTLTTLVSFNGSGGASPEAGLLLGNDGDFYGTTWAGGSAYQGTIFQVTTNGTLNTLISFNGTNGSRSAAGLTLGADGSFYGTTVYGGGNGYGTVFCLLLTPVITAQPQSQTNYAGATAIFVISANNLFPSLIPLSYQFEIFAAVN